MTTGNIDENNNPFTRQIFVISSGAYNMQHISWLQSCW